jgi:hypothetical protein
LRAYWSSIDSLDDRWNEGNAATWSCPLEVDRDLFGAPIGT